VLVGASRGGYATLVAAARGDPRPRGLVLVEIAPRIDQSGAAQVRGFMQSSIAGFPDVEEAAEVLAKYMNRAERKDPERLRRSMRQGGDGRWYWRWDPQLAKGISSDPARAEQQLEDAAAKLTCTVLLVRGALSEIVRDEHAAHFKSLVPHARVVTIAGVGHMVSGDDNDLFNAAIVNFMASLKPANASARVEAL
jgi:pimeloyl-ACP methyl ester carboxylesterase